jgi:radical SAM protein with 4Fe4S-binding SPASM domain
MAYSGSNSKMKDLIYGRYIAEQKRIHYDNESIERIKSRTASNMSDCQKCEILYNCAGACLGEALNETGSMFGIKEDVCDTIRYLAKHVPLNQGMFPYIHP